MTSLLLPIIYLAFISLGLPDSLLGAAWPAMYGELDVPLSYAGIVSMIIAVGTVLSSLLSDRVTRKWGAGRVTVCSVAMTAAALLGFSFSPAFLPLCLWAVPYGLGAGSVDAALNNYVALHYESRHMSWLHCMWGLGATAGPYIMGRALTGGFGWSSGYRWVGLLQLVLTAGLLFSLPLWKGRGAKSGEGPEAGNMPVTLRELLRVPGARAGMLCFFCYCALEQTAGLWACSYLTLYRGLPPETAAGYAGLFFVGITLGRALSGFLTLRLDDAHMVRLGEALIAMGILALPMPGPPLPTLAGLVLIGLGCAPVYPCLIHATPGRFGAERSQAIIGVEMASAYVGTCAMPPLFGALAGQTTVAWLPAYLLAALLLMAVTHEALLRRVRNAAGGGK